MTAPAHYVPTSVQTRDGVTLTLRAATAEDTGVWAGHVRDDLEHLGGHLPWPAQTATGGGTILMAHDPLIAAVELGCWIVRRYEGQWSCALPASRPSSTRAGHSAPTASPGRLRPVMTAHGCSPRASGFAMRVVFARPAYTKDGARISTSSRT